MVTQVRNAPLTVNNVVTYDCVIGVNNADQKLKPGMTANVSIVIASRQGTIKIPNSALRFHPSDTNVIVNLPVAASPTNSTQMAQGSGGNTNRVAGQGQGRRNRNGHSRGERQIVHSVYVLAPDSTEEHPKMMAVPIKTGISDGINTEVTEGLKEGDRLVTARFSPAQRPPPARIHLVVVACRACADLPIIYFLCRINTSSSWTPFTRFIIPVKWTFMPCAASRSTSRPVNLWRSWAPVVPANPH
ncbi:MAG: hypothetical protein WDN00_15445 [Limisphaerales bacterium]